MTTDRITRVNELLKREISLALFRLLAPEERVDTAAVTVTHVLTSRNLRHARVWISILGHEEERAFIMQQVREHRTQIQQWINRNVKLKYTPRLDFELDLSVEKGDHVLEILQSLEPDPTEAQDPESAASEDRSTPGIQDHE